MEPRNYLKLRNENNDSGGFIRLPIQCKEAINHFGQEAIIECIKMSLEMMATDLNQRFSGRKIKQQSTQRNKYIQMMNELQKHDKTLCSACGKSRGITNHRG